MMQNTIVWAFVAIIGFFVVGEIFESPEVKAMRECARGMPDSQRQIECARAIFGDE